MCVCVVVVVVGGQFESIRVCVDFHRNIIMGNARPTTEQTNDAQLWLSAETLINAQFVVL